MHESVGCSEAENLKVRDSLHVYEQREEADIVCPGWLGPVYVETDFRVQ